MGNIGVGKEVFEAQSTITSAHFGSQCKFIDFEAFRDCISLDDINEDNVIETIGGGAFSNTTLSYATFDNLTKIDNDAFKDCSKLSYISIPNCEIIEQQAFANCISLTEIDAPKASYIGSGAFASCSNLSTISIPNCSIIYPSAFYTCSNLQSVNINETEIYSYAFFGCSKLSDIYLDNCTSIGSGAFKDCTSLNTINLNKCKTIWHNAFYGTNITQVTLSVCEQIYPSAFANCPNLTKVYINHNDKTCQLMGDYVFCIHNPSSSLSSEATTSPEVCEINKDIVFYFKPNTIEYYKTAPYWSHYAKNMVMMTNEKQIIYITANNEKISLDSDNEYGYSKNEYYNKYGMIEFNNTVKTLNQIFKNQKELSSLDLPSECTIIGEGALEGCEKLKSITLPKVIEEIQNYAFKNCESLISFTIPDTINVLGEGVFTGCKNINKFDGKYVTYGGRAVVYDYTNANSKKESTLICVLPIDNTNTEGRIHKISDIDKNITRLGNACFYGCEMMRRVDIPSNVTSIGDSAFENCSNLCEVHFSGNTPPTLGKNVFNGVREDFKIFVPEDKFGIYHNEWKNSDFADKIYPMPKNGIIYYGDGTETFSLTIPVKNTAYTYGKGGYYKISNVTGIPANYFASKTTITEVIIGEGVTSIGEGAFKDCTGLKYIYTHDSISSFGKECFRNCNELTRIHIPKGCTFGNDVFYICENLKEFGTYYKGYVTDDNRCYIDGDILRFFAPSEYTDAYTIPNNIKTIGQSAFRRSNINKIILNQSVKTIGAYAFSECSKMKTIEDWDGVERISKSAFYNCDGLDKIKLPNELKIIEREAFIYCDNVYIDGNIPNSVTEIGAYAFQNCTNFKCVNDKEEQVTLALNNITTINTQVFYMCESLEKVSINNGITTIGVSSFEGCKNLNLVSTKTVNYIEKNAFKDCEKLSRFYLPNGLLYIGESAFENCTKFDPISPYILTDIGIIYQNDIKQSIPYTVASMGNACFKNCGITELHILDYSHLTEIPDSAFENCSKLQCTDIATAKKITYIGKNAFKDCTQLCSYENILAGKDFNDLKSSHLSIGRLYLPDNIINIGDSAFENCGISYVKLPSKLKYIGNHSFYHDSNDLEVHIPMQLSTPPLFLRKDISSLNSLPFNKDKCGIFIHRYNINKYKTHSYWKPQYSNNISVDNTLDIYIDLTQASLDSHILDNSKFKIANAVYGGTIDQSRSIYLYNSFWRCHGQEFTKVPYSFSIQSSYVIVLSVNIDDMTLFLLDSGTTYDTLNVSIPMYCTSHKSSKFRILVNLEHLGQRVFEGSDSVSYTPNSVMLSMNARTYNGEDWDGTTTFLYRGSNNHYAMIHLIGDSLHEYSDEIPENYIPVPGYIKYDVCPSVMYATDKLPHDISRFELYCKLTGLANKLYPMKYNKHFQFGEHFSLLGYFKTTTTSNILYILSNMRMRERQSGVVISLY